MKQTLISSGVVAIGIALGFANWGSAVSWPVKLDARPEAVLTGMALLALASILHRSRPGKGAR
jgi:hypothetical protein